MLYYTGLDNEFLLEAATKLGEKWKQLGATLGMNPHDIEGIYEKHSGDQNFAAWVMLIHWRDVSKATSNRRAILTRALRKLNRQHKAANQSPVSVHGKSGNFFIFLSCVYINCMIKY